MRPVVLPLLLPVVRAGVLSWRAIVGGDVGDADTSVSHGSVLHGSALHGWVRAAKFAAKLAGALTAVLLVLLVAAMLVIATFDWNRARP